MTQVEAQVLVAAHKPYWMPADPLYVPVQVGAAGKDPIEGFRRDDDGDGISHLNPRYCELTALWWGWKNLDAPHLGLAHYRRHFKGEGERGTLTLDEARELVAKAPVVLPKLRKYYIETIESHYAHTFDMTHLDVVREVLAEREPSYSRDFEAHMRERSAHVFNMFIMRKDVLDAYLSWLFPLLAEIDARLDYTGMDAFQARAVGRLSERLLDPWLSHNGVTFVERPVVDMEPVNWVKKGGSFLLAKFAGKKYGKSF